MSAYYPDFNALEPQIIQMLSKGFAHCPYLSPVEGGLFNDIYRWVPAEGITDENGHEVAFFLKQYQNCNRSSIFAPPAIDKKIRCAVAFKMHQLFNVVNKGQNITTPIHCMDQHDLLITQEVSNPRPLVDYLASGEILWEPLALLMAGIARLHLGAKDALTESELKANAVFRDYKLKLQYDDLAAGLEGSKELKTEITSLAEKYKTQKFALLHGDLNSRNIIINAENKSLGVIDFEQSHIGNPVYDLAYILSEVYMACLYHGIGTEAIARRLLNAYAASNTKFNLGNALVDFKKHLGVQILYRIYGPSRRAWSFYLNDSKKRMQIIEAAKSMMMQSERLILDEYI